MSQLITEAAPTFQTERMGVSRTTRAMSQEASTLGLGPGRLPYGRLYNDAADLGLRLMSHETGEVTSWVWHHTDKDGDDVHGWRFAPTAETLRKHPQLEGYELLIIND